MSTRNISWGGKGGLSVGLTALTPSCASCLEIREPHPPGTVEACPRIALYLPHENISSYTFLETVSPGSGSHLRKTGMYESSECTICHLPDSTTDKEHLLYCPKLDTDQQPLKNTIKLYWDARGMMR